LLIDARHRIIASSDGQGILQDTFALDTDGRARGHYMTESAVTAFAQTPGYETYQGLGWYGVVESKAA
jgi:hypothetical protein